LLTCAHTAWKLTSALLLFGTSAKETVENLKISLGQFAPSKEQRIKLQQTLISAGCKVLEPNAGFLLASMPSFCGIRQIECSCSQSVFVSVPQDKIRGLAICFCTRRRDAQLENWLLRPPEQSENVYSTPLHNVKVPMQYRNDIRALGVGAPLRIPALSQCRQELRPRREA